MNNTNTSSNKAYSKSPKSKINSIRIIESDTRRKLKQVNEYFKQHPSCFSSNKIGIKS